MMTPVLTDPATFPTEATLAKFLKRAHPAFRALFDYNHERFPQFEERWKFYNDGKCWLMNVSRKKKTVFWLSVGDGMFRTAFYLNQKAKKAVRSSHLSSALKEAFNASAGKQLIGLAVEIRKKKDIDAYKEALEIKMNTIS